MKPSRSADRQPTRWSAGLFVLKASVFQLMRAVRGGAPPRLMQGEASPGARLLAQSRSALFASEVAAEFALQAGKVQNLRVAARRLHGLFIPAGEVFSFWAHVPRPTRRRGFVDGRELREGCIIPSVGGGLCQLSNALYDVALTAGCEIVERHAHSREVPGSMAAAGRDATVFWNYVDLRFRPASDCRLEVRLTGAELVVRLLTSATSSAVSALAVRVGPLLAPVESCETCDVTDCFRHPPPPAKTNPPSGSAAWLVDAWTPEFDRYLEANRQPADWLFLPLDGARFRLGNYRWNTRDFARVRQAPGETLRRSLASRRLAAQGAERQRALLRFDQQLAQRYARGLPSHALHLIVHQPLLPHLWRAGVLGGRTFDVLMTRLPIAVLQETLDRAAALHPGCRTLADFRAPAQLVADESEALAAARHWITPHSEIARLAGGRAVRLPWDLPSPPPARAAPGNDVLFPASTLGRKGAYELAEAARALGRRVQLGGPALEGAGIWRGVEILPARENWAGVAAVVLPAWVEHQPRRLLRAIAAGVPVIATEDCGLAGVPGVTTVPAGDVSSLIEQIGKLPRDLVGVAQSVSPTLED